LKDFLQKLRTAAPLLICVGILFPWAVSPFGIAACSKQGSFVPESRSVLRQWLPLEVQLDTAVNQKEDPPTLGGLDEVEVFYFDPIIIAFLFAGFLLWALCQRGRFVQIILARCLLGLIWLYLTAVLTLIFSLSSRDDLWLQPGILLVAAGYLLLTFSGAWNLYAWIAAKIKISP
jgi:hypothetical protein